MAENVHNIPANISTDVSWWINLSSPKMIPMMAPILAAPEQMPVQVTLYFAGNVSGVMTHMIPKVAEVK